MKLFRLLFLAFVFGLSSVASANDFEIALGSKAAQFKFRSDSSLIGWGGAELGVDYFYNEEDDHALTVSLLQVRQATAENPLTFGVGIKAYLANLDGVDDAITALAAGGEVRYTIPGPMPMGLFFNLSYAPNITSFSGADGVLDYLFRFQIELLPQTVAFVGVRHLEIDHENDSSYELEDNQIHLGVRLTF